MKTKQEPWLFLQLRAAQLFEEDDPKGALRLMKHINLEQQRRFLSLNAEQNQTEPISFMDR